jgi:hypothetical protein
MYCVRTLPPKAKRHAATFIQRCVCVGVRGYLVLPVRDATPVATLHKGSKTQLDAQLARAPRQILALLTRFNGALGIGRSRSQLDEAV